MRKLESRLLIVEDDYSMRENVLMPAVEKLGKRIGCCDLACNYDEAAELVNKRAYDLAIVNYVLPGSGFGDELIPVIKSKNPNCYVIGTSQTPQFAEIFKKAGADDFIAYPVMSRMVFDKLREVLSRKKEFNLSLHKGKV